MEMTSVSRWKYDKNYSASGRNRVVIGRFSTNLQHRDECSALGTDRIDLLLHDPSAISSWRFGYRSFVASELSEECVK